jgi:hypothetical protein
MRTLLRRTGSPQQDAPKAAAKDFSIGTRPDLEQLINAL